MGGVRFCCGYPMRKWPAGVRCGNAWQAGETPTQIGADVGATGKQVGNWIQWAKRKFASGGVWSNSGVEQRRRMLEQRNAGQSWEMLAEQYGITAKTASEYLRRARKEAQLGIGGDRPVAEPLLEWLSRLGEPFVRMSEAEFLGEAAAAMGHPVERKAVMLKLRFTDWRLKKGWLVRRNNGLPSARLSAKQREVRHQRTPLSGDETARRLQVLRRTQAGERPRHIAADLGVTSRKVRNWTCWARDYTGAIWEADQRMSRWRMLDMRNAGHPYGVISDAFSVAESTVSNELSKSRKEVEFDADGWGPPAEPLLDWLSELPPDWVGMRKQEFLGRAAEAMGHPMTVNVVNRKLAHSGWELRHGRRLVRCADTAMAEAA